MKKNSIALIVASIVISVIIVCLAAIIIKKNHSKTKNQREKSSNNKSTDESIMLGNKKTNAQKIVTKFNPSDHIERIKKVNGANKSLDEIVNKAIDNEKRYSVNLETQLKLQIQNLETPEYQQMLKSAEEAKNRSDEAKRLNKEKNEQDQKDREEKKILAEEESKRIEEDRRKESAKRAAWFTQMSNLEGELKSDDVKRKEVMEFIIKFINENLLKDTYIEKIYYSTLNKMKIAENCSLDKLVSNIELCSDVYLLFKVSRYGQFMKEHDKKLIYGDYTISTVRDFSDSNLKNILKTNLESINPKDKFKNNGEYSSEHTCFYILNNEKMAKIIFEMFFIPTGKDGVIKNGTASAGLLKLCDQECQNILIASGAVKTENIVALHYFFEECQNANRSNPSNDLEYKGNSMDDSQLVK